MVYQISVLIVEKHEVPFETYEELIHQDTLGPA